MPREVYDKIPALSATVLKKWLTLHEIPGEFWWWLTVDRWKEEMPEWLLLGSALDCLMLERDQFSAKYAILPDNPPRRPSKIQVNAKNPSNETVAAISFWHKFDTESKGKRILTDEQYDAVRRMYLSLMGAPVVAGVFPNCQKAVIVAELWGLPCKCEIDLWNPKVDHIMDLKTARDIDPAAFTRAAQNFGYLEQATFYMLMADAAGHPNKKIFSFIGVKSSEPYTVSVKSFAPLVRDDHGLVFAATSERLRRAAVELTDRLTTNDFADSTEWGMLEFPAWYLRDKSLTLALGYG
jgi:hypothetical protein